MLSPGTCLGPYEIQTLVGSGGMGDVYRARDTRLDRIVAVKVLKSSLAEDPGFRERFDREARAVSRLSHPNICTLHDVGRTDKTVYLVMEYLEGETLAVRLERGDMSLDEALACGVQIADALDKAHRKGIVHGDLKPGNVMLTKTGAKLLDFGLAGQLPASPAEASDLATRAVPAPSPQVLGTLPYFAPEQLEGKPADRRSDIFAFGALLYEIVTGRRAFGADSFAGVVAGIMRSDPPPMVSIRPSAPAALDRVVATCLAKDPDDRWQDAGDLARELKWASGGGPAGATITPAGRGWRDRLALPLILLFALAVAVLALTRFFSPRTGAAPVYRTSIVLPEGLMFPGPGQLGGLGRFAISPDGRRVVFVAADPGGSVRLWVRSLDSLAATPLPETSGAGSPFWSPDSRLIAFVAAGQLKTVDPSGGVPFTVSPAFNATGSWNGDNLILFSPNAGSGLSVVPATGGTPRQVTQLDRSARDVLHRNGFFLPDNRHFLYVAVSAREGETTGARAVYAGSLDGGESPRIVLEGGSPVAYAHGHLLFLRNNRVVAQPFDLDRLELRGEPTPLTDQIELSGPSFTTLAVTESGLLAYQPRAGPGSQLTWFDREGRTLGTLGEPADYGDVDLSPDGRRAVVSVLDPTINTRDLWLYDITRGVRTRLTVDPADEVAPVWSADGTRLMFSSNRAGHYDLYEKVATGASSDEIVLKDDSEKYPVAWSSDGQSVLYWTFGSGGAQLRLLSLAGGRTSSQFLGPAVNPGGRFSPDGRWLAYSSMESGRSEVSVVSFPSASANVQLSDAGGSLPQWRGDGRELFYAGRDNKLQAVKVSEHGDELEVGAPRALFDVRPVGPRSFFDVTPDGQRFLVNSRRNDSPSSAIAILQNWVALTPP